MAIVEVIDVLADGFAIATGDDPAGGAAADVDAGTAAGRDVAGQDATDPTPLSQAFVEHLARSMRGVPGPSGAASGTRHTVDWARLQAARQGAQTPEQAEGRVVLEAFRHISGSSPPPSIMAGPQPAATALLEPGPLPTQRPPIGPPPEPHTRLLPAPPPPVQNPPPPPPPDTTGPLPGAVHTVEDRRPRGWQRLHRREKLATAFGWMRNIGIVVILFAAWQVWGTSISQHQAQQSLRGQFQAQIHTPAGTGSEPRLIAADVAVPQPKEGSLVARLQIPAIGVDEYVVQGTAEGDLAMGPGHYVGTSMPGQAGNVAIAGHRTTYGAPFNDLDSLVSGDPIFLTSDSGVKLEYTVSQAPVAVSPSDVAVLNFFGDNRLTLTTCNPRFSSSQRLVVVALLRQAVETPPTAATGSARGRDLHVSGGGTVGWNLIYLLPVLALLGAMVLLGFANKGSAKYFGRRTRWLILAPIWVAATYVLFTLLTSLLPATL